MGLTQRQADVARLRFAGLSIEEVAKRLGTSTRRVARIMEEVRRAMGG
jgi:transcriptional regulator